MSYHRDKFYLFSLYRAHLHNATVKMKSYPQTDEGVKIMSNFDPTRREAIKRVAITGAGTLAAGYIVGLAGAANAVAAEKTPAQPEGPFYPVRDQLDKDADMTRVAGRTASALGAPILLSGKVVDVATGQPLVGALVEFWQACESGKYNHPRDPNNAPLDPNFQYWAQVVTDSDGRFGLKTIKPGAYPAGGGWVRPPHIHVKVHKAGYPSLTTQLYFAGDEYNDADQILGRLTPAQRDLVTVDFKEDQSGVVRGDWTVYLARFVSGQSAETLSRATPELE